MSKQYTIVVCTYNGEKNLSECLNALLNLKEIDKLVQKIIVVDNNSIDGTRKIIEEYERKNKIISYEFEEKQGLSYAREHAVRAQTSWVIYVDDDNILDENWLIELNRTISKNENLGVVNGAVIAKPVAGLSDEQQMILKVMFRNLACTHLEEPQVNDKINKIPMGAGMCIRTDALIEIEREGWLSLLGRTGKNLASGEDSELCNRVFKQGYEYSCNYNMKLWHLIPKDRLSEDYAVKLLCGLVDGRVALLKKQRHAAIKRSLRKMKWFIKGINSTRKMSMNSKNSIEYWKGFVDSITAKRFLEKL